LWPVLPKKQPASFPPRNARHLGFDLILKTGPFDWSFGCWGDTTKGLAHIESSYTPLKNPKYNVLSPKKNAFSPTSYEKISVLKIKSYIFMKSNYFIRNIVIVFFFISRRSRYRDPGLLA
jgi:hypothetical protein